MPTIHALLERNKAWARGVSERDPDFFPTLAQQQSPRYLWIGCSDSRVPANQVVDLAPGEVFVHRNIANVVVHTDLNLLSVMQYAVEVLRVEHVIVCGHYGCGGVRAAMGDKRLGLIDNWLRHIQDVAHAHESELGGIEDPELRVDRLCELHVQAQMQNVVATTIVQDAWERGQELSVHGLVYGLHDGVLRDLGQSVGDSSGVTASHRMRS